MNTLSDQTFWWYMGSIKTPIMQKTTILESICPGKFLARQFKESGLYQRVAREKLHRIRMKRPGHQNILEAIEESEYS